MALNEHKNLDDNNLHVPKGFSTAANSTVITKNGTGNLEWTAISNTGFGQVVNYRFQGYSTVGTSYEYGQSFSDSQSPFEMNASYGSGTVGAATIGTSNMVRTAQGIAIPNNMLVSKIRGWITGNAEATATLAFCKVTPTDGSTAALTPVAIDEIAKGVSTNSTLVEIDETTFDLDPATLTAGDILFPMIKCSVASTLIYFNVQVQTVLT